MYPKATYALSAELERIGVFMDSTDVNTLRRAGMTLHRWAEMECGIDNGCVEVDDDGTTWWHDSRSGRRWRTPNRERGAVKRVQAVCNKYSLQYYHQGDPRGAVLRVGPADWDMDRRPQDGVPV